MNTTVKNMCRNNVESGAKMNQTEIYKQVRDRVCNQKRQIWDQIGKQVLNPIKNQANQIEIK